MLLTWLLVYISLVVSLFIGAAYIPSAPGSKECLLGSRTLAKVGDQRQTDGLWNFGRGEIGISPINMGFTNKILDWTKQCTKGKCIA